MDMLYPFPVEIIAEIDSRLTAIDVRFAEHNRKVATHSPSLQIIADSPQSQHCRFCGQDKPLFDFPVVERRYSADIPVIDNIKNYACWDCLYNEAITKLMSNGNLKHNPFWSYSYVPVQRAISDEWIVLGECFCGKKAEDWHHYKYQRPLVGQCYCKKHHKQLHNVIKAVWRAFGYIPDHQKRKYYIPRLNKETGRFFFVPRPEYSAEIEEARNLLTFREQLRQERDRELERMDKAHIAHLYKVFGPVAGKMIADSYKVKQSGGKK